MGLAFAELDSFLASDDDSGAAESSSDESSAPGQLQEPDEALDDVSEHESDDKIPISELLIRRQSQREALSPTGEFLSCILIWD